MELVPRETLAKGNVIITSDFGFIAGHKYDEVLFSLVLQHIHPDEMRYILTSLSLRASRFVLHSRIWVDFTFEKISPILADYFTCESIEFQQDPNSDNEDHFIGVFVPKTL